MHIVVEWQGIWKLKFEKQKPLLAMKLNTYVEGAIII
jgi:hypothetical protein